MSKITVDISQLEKDLNGIVYEVVNRKLGELKLKEIMYKHVNKYLESHLDKKIKSKVYEFLEESQIAVPIVSTAGWHQEKKITLNQFIIQIVHEFVSNRVHALMKDFTIRITKDLKEDDNTK